MASTPGDPDHPRLSWRYPARVSDLNPGGHLDNLHILRVADETRFQLLGMREPSGATITPGLLDQAPRRVVSLVAAHRADYLRELWYSPTEPLQSQLWVCRLGGSSFDLACEIRQDPQAPVAARVVTTIVLVDLDAGAPWALDDTVRGALTAYLGPPPGLRARG